MNRHRKLTFCVVVLVLLVLACGPLQTPVATLAPSSTSTLMIRMDLTSTPAPTNTLVPTPVSTTTSTPTSPPTEKWAGPFRSVTSLANLLVDSFDDAQIHAPDDGSVWIITDQTVLRWKDQTWDFKFPKREDMLATVDESGRLWMLPPDKSEIRVWQDRKWKSYGADSGWTKALMSKIGLWWASMPWGVSIGTNGAVWLPTDQDARELNGDRWNVYTLDDMGYPSQDAEDIGIVHSLALTEDGAEVWVGECYYSGPGPMGGNGVRWFDGETWYGAESPIDSRCVSAMEVDHTGNLWFGVMKTIWRYEPAAESWTSYSLPDELLMGYNFTLPRQLIIDRSEDIWVMMEMCGGASCSGLANLYRIHAGEWSLIAESEDWTLRHKQLVLDGIGQGWLFWDGTVFQLERESMQPVASLMVRSVGVSPDGRVWVLEEIKAPSLWVFEPKGVQ